MQAIFAIIQKINEIQHKVSIINLATQFERAIISSSNWQLAAGQHNTRTSVVYLLVFYSSILHLKRAFLHILNTVLYNSQNDTHFHVLEQYNNNIQFSFSFSTALKNLNFLVLVFVAIGVCTFVCVGGCQPRPQATPRFYLAALKKNRVFSTAAR